MIIKKEKEIRYTVIIPHKNCPELLERCLESIPDRNDIQTIIVDDNSDDLQPIQILERRFPGRISVIYTNAGKGAGYARNKGLERARGKWLLFADSDDYYTKEAFNIFDNYQDSDADIIAFKHRSVYSDTGEDAKRSDARNKYIENYVNNKNEQSEAKLRYCNDVPWAKMVRRSMVMENHIQFDEVPASNDTMFSLMSGYHAKSIVADENVVYNVTVRQGSITKTKSIERYFSDHCVALRKNKFVREIGHPECQEIILSRILIVAKLFGVKQALRFLKEVKKYKGQLFFGISSKFGFK